MYLYQHQYRNGLKLISNKAAMFTLICIQDRNKINPASTINSHKFPSSEQIEIYSSKRSNQSDMNS